jgi:acyl-CoA dehydrogenase
LPILPLPCRASARGPISFFGDDEQRKTWLPKTRSGKANSGILAVGAASGSDVANISTTARRDGNGFVIDGEKTWISNGGIADFYIVFARTGEAPGARGLSAFVVEAVARVSRLPSA